MTRLFLAVCMLVLAPWAAAVEPTHAPMIIYAPDLPPYVVANPDGSTRGLMVDVVNEACKRAGVTARIEVVPWPRGYAQVQAKPNLGLIPTMRTAEREQLFRFTEQPVFRYTETFFKQKGARIAWNGTMASIADQRMVKLRGALSAPPIDDALKSGQIRAEDTGSFETAMQMVAANRADLAPMPLVTGLSIIKQQGLEGKVEPMEPEVYVQPVYLVMSKAPENAELVTRLDKALEQMWKDGTIKGMTGRFAY